VPRGLGCHRMPDAARAAGDHHNTRHVGTPSRASIETVDPSYHEIG
jgi:hypothetical protein